jgi:hypothetical protein
MYICMVFWFSFSFTSYHTSNDYYYLVVCFHFIVFYCKIGILCLARLSTPMSTMLPRSKKVRHLQWDPLLAIENFTDLREINVMFKPYFEIPQNDNQHLDKILLTPFKTQRKIFLIINTKKLNSGILMYRTLQNFLFL